MVLDEPDTRRILAFLERIGIPVAIEPILGTTFLPGLAVRGGDLVVDPEQLAWPGDLLHEAGHIAVTNPAERSTLDSIADDPGEEMAAIAWSWAASVEIGVDPAILFHDGGYRGGSHAMIANFTAGRDVGVPMLEYFGIPPAGREPRPRALGRIRTWNAGCADTAARAAKSEIACSPMRRRRRTEPPREGGHEGGAENLAHRR